MYVFLFLDLCYWFRGPGWWEILTWGEDVDGVGLTGWQVYWRRGYWVVWGWEVDEWGLVSKMVWGWFVFWGKGQVGERVWGS